MCYYKYYKYVTYNIIGGDNIQMIDVPLKIQQPFNRDSLKNINACHTREAFSSQTIININKGKAAITANAAASANTVMSATSAGHMPVSSAHISKINIPELKKQIAKGQKATLFYESAAPDISAKFGWNVNNTQCDVDVSAFLLGDSGKVIGDSWFVFYGQQSSPDNSVKLHTTAIHDRESIDLSLSRLNPAVKKIVFVLTINEAYEKKLNFSMLCDAYVRIMNISDNSELASFKMYDYYDNVTSMMIGELYRYNGVWKFNAIGNGVTRDLAGLCDLYGVETN